ncbi:MAG TPA: ChbG/HpnK family deacetylase [Terriglobia bacterium]|nr:ChbG/HpnK family deacetylase [Terriglobia bacterium]
MVPVVINADDFGLTEGVCKGIVKAIQTGSVTATTAMACVPGAVERLTRWAPEITGRIGAHLQLTSGVPVLSPERVPSLVPDGERFPSNRKAVRAPNTEEILAEWRAQMELLLRAGIEPTHIDSHHHIHRLPSALPAFCEIAKQYGLPARSVDTEMTRALLEAGVFCLGKTVTGWYGGDLSLASLVQLLKEGARECPQPQALELMCHPGLADDDLAGVSRYTSERENELAVLCDRALQKELAVAGFSLATMASAAGISRPMRALKRMGSRYVGFPGLG